MDFSIKKIFLVGLIIMGSLVFSGCSLLDRKNKSGLQVITNDIPVSIFINNEFLGKSPFLTKDLKPGEYSIKLEPEDPKLATYETTINLNKNLLTVITWKPGTTLTNSGGAIYELEKLTNSNQTQLAIISIPDGAILGIDEGEKEFSPLIKNNIEIGSHEFVASLPSYETQNHTLNIVKGHRLNVLIKLAKEDDNLTNSETTAALENETNLMSDNEATETGTVMGLNTNLNDSLLAPSPTPQPLRQPTTENTLAGSQVLIKTTQYFENDQEVLRVREASSAASKTLGYAQVGQFYRYLNEKTKDWLKIEFNNKIGWVSSKYAEIK